MVYFIEIVLAVLAVEGFLKIINSKKEDGMFHVVQYILGSAMVWTLLMLLERYVLNK